ncbi:MAG: molybdenum cofactor biosynthesis protein MoaE [Methanophagales archaeon ANME-1-THS]|nr:MAG: molybdenum cofactor biosynthesis protein MoaE [Methanophagales archaeon ANME-1-THS]
MITNEDFSIDELVRGMKKPEIGAIVTFLGVVRADAGLKGLNVEIYEEMAEQELRRLERAAREQFEIEAVEIVHRAGSLKVGENIVVILVGAKHRKEAFQACEYLIDELKKRVPIWKKELEE